MAGNSRGWARGVGFPVFAVVMVKRNRNVCYSGSLPEIGGTLKLNKGATNKGTMCKSASRVWVKHTGRHSTLGSMRMSLPIPTAEAAR